MRISCLMIKQCFGRKMEENITYGGNISNANYKAGALLQGNVAPSCKLLLLPTPNNVLPRLPKIFSNQNNEL